MEHKDTLFHYEDVKHRSKFPTEVLQILSLEDFRSRLNESLSKMV